MTFTWNNKCRENAKDVDLDSQVQNKTFKEIYESRTGETINIEELIK